MRMKLMQLILVGMIVMVFAVTAYAQGPLPIQGNPTTIITGTSPQAGPAGGGSVMLPIVGGPVMGGGEFTLGSDGTIYIMSYVAATSKTSASTTLTAYSGTTGKFAWSLTFSVGNLSQPVPAPDGRLFLVAGGHPAYTTKNTTAAAENAQLFIVTAKGTYTTVTLPGEMASAPVFFGSSSGYTYYFTVTSVTQGSSLVPVATTVLYAYTSKTDTEVFSIPLSQ